MHEACGICGICARGERVATLIYHGNLAHQHRGQEASGIATSDGKEIRAERQFGRVDRFGEDQIERLSGSKHCPAVIAIGHNRYSNTGGNIEANVQPFVVGTGGGPLALAHNGNILEPQKISAKLKKCGIFPRGSSDSELIALLIAHETSNVFSFEEAITNALRQVTGAYSLVMMTKDKLIGLRDPWGIRPLSLGRFNSHHYMIASETCAFKALGAKFIQDVQPGEMVIIEEGKEPKFIRFLPAVGNFLCIFEFIYFGFPGSVMYNHVLDSARRHMGEELWKEHQVKAENLDEWIVVGVPNTGLPAAQGYSEASGIKLRTGLTKNNYVGRTFIQPDHRLRRLGVRAKIQTSPVVRNRKVVVIEDSIVRGTTTGEIVDMLFEEGAKEVHVRITSPPYRYRCYMGVDTQYENDLIAATKSVEEIRQHIHATSLGYLSIEGVLRAINRERGVSPIPGDFFCKACFTGQYPFPVPEYQGRDILEKS